MKKTQFELLPLFFFLIFVFMFMVIGLIVYFQYWMNKVKEHQNYLSKIAYFTVGEQIVSSPYLNCGRITEKFSCLDYYKIRHFKELVNNYDEIKRNLDSILLKYGQKKVVVKVIFNKGKTKCETLPLSFSNLDCDYYVLYDIKNGEHFIKKDVLRVPILIRYKDNEESDFNYKVGILVVENFY